MTGSAPPPEPAPLAELLEARQEDIIQRWSKRVEGLTPDGLPRAELVDSLPEFLRETVAELRRQLSGERRPPSQLLFLGQSHGMQRCRVGSNINAVVREYDALRDVLLEVIEESGQPLRVAEWRVLSQALTLGIAEAVSHFSAERERALRAREEQLQAIIDGASSYIYVKDLEGRYLLANAPWKESFHGGREVRGKTDHEVFPPHIADRYRENDLRVLRTRSPVQVEEESLAEEGVRTYLSVKFPLSDAEGRPYAVCGISTDITDRKRLEAERQRAVDALEHGDAFFVLDRDWRMVLVNRNQERLSRTRREETLGRVFWEVFPSIAHPDNPYWREYHRVMRERVSVEFEGYYPSLDLWTGVTAYPTQDGGIAVFFRDITEKKRIEAARELFLEAGGVLASSLDLGTTLRSLASIMAERLADYCIVDLLGDDGRFQRVEVATQDEALRPLLERARAYPPRLGSGSPLTLALERGEPVAIPEITSKRVAAAALDAEHRAILEALAPKSSVIVPLSARGRKLGIISLGWVRPHVASLERDLEVARVVAAQAAVAIDNARLYQEAQEAVKLREELVAIVSHDLRNPLAAISMSTSVLLKREDLSPAMAKGLSRIYAATDRATRMISDLLDFTQARVGALPLHPRPADFHELARHVVEEVQIANPDRHLRVELAGDGQGAWDVDRVAQVITNLVGNAVQHSPPDTPVRISVRGEGEAMVLEVHNRGAPIPASVLPMLFEPFRRGREASAVRGSVGLGLYITQQVVLGHGGHLDVRSTVEEGTTFTVRLPRRPPSRPAAPEG